MKPSSFDKRPLSASENLTTSSNPPTPPKVKSPPLEAVSHVKPMIIEKSNEHVEPCITTLKLHHLPRLWDATNLISCMVSEPELVGRFDFVYVPMDFAYGGNLR
jgi:hypothetical protein